MSKKDWRNFEKRREEALMSPGGSGGGYQNHGFVQDDPRRVSNSYKSEPQSNKIGLENYNYTSGNPPPPSYYNPAPGSSAVLQQQQLYYQQNTGNNFNQPGLRNSNKYQGQDQDQDRVDSQSNEESEYEDFLATKKRKCRDVICLILFGGFIVSLVVLVGIAWSQENVTKLINWDKLDETCTKICDDDPDLNLHLNDQLAKFKKFGFGPSDSAADGPDESSSNAHHFLLYELKNGIENQGRFRARSNFAQQVETNKSDVKISCEMIPKCPKNYIRKGNKCFETRASRDPVTGFLTFEDAIGDVKDFYQEIVEDFEKSWKDILIITAIALALALLMTVLLRFFAGVIVWVVVVGISLAAVAGTAALWILWSRKDSNENGTKTQLLVASIAASVITAVILLVLLGMRKRIALVIRLFKEAGRAIHAMPFILLQPIWTFLSLIVIMGGWLGVLILVESAGELTKEEGSTSFPPCKLEKSWVLLIGRWWNLFALFWVSQFVLGCQDLIIAGAISTWFFSRNKSRIGFPIWNSFYRLMRYHLGSVAFGSLIVAIVKMIRAILNWIQKKIGGTNPVCKAIVCCCQCFTWCLEKFLIFLSRNAYIEIAIYGYGFCKSARKAFKVLVSNALRVAAINSIGDFVLFLAKLAIVVVTMIIGYELMKDRYYSDPLEDPDHINHIWAPLFVAAVFSYFIAHCFITVYEMAIDTIFICFCEDCALNDGVNSPYYMSKGLMEFVKFNRKAAAQKEKKEK